MKHRWGRALFVGLLALTCPLLTPRPAAAYERDTHYLLTYVLSRTVGFDENESLQIASADQALDDNKSTVAVPIFFYWQKSYYVERGRRWHALDFSREEQLRQKDRLWKRACDAQGARQLAYLGQYFHFMQDHYAHRRLELTGWPEEHWDPNQEWAPYDPLVGHFFDGSQPDRIPNHREKALAMALQAVAELQRFRSECLHREPSGPVPPNRIPDLVKEFVEALATAYEGPPGKLREADLDKSRKALQKVLDRWEITDCVVEWKQRIRYRFDLMGDITNPPTVNKALKNLYQGAPRSLIQPIK